MSTGPPSSHHRHLARQLRKLGLHDEAAPPDPATWRAFLDGVNRTYEETDLERYTLERSVAVFEREMEELNAKLGAERDQLRLIFEAAPVGIVRCELDGRVAMANPALGKMLGYTEAEILALGPGPLVHPDDREEVVTVLRAAGSGRGREPYTATRRFLHRSGATVYTRLSVSVATDAEQRPLFTLAVVKDVSEMIRLEMELRHSQKLESVGRLAAGIAHEINTPVQFVGDSVRFVHEALDDLVSIVGSYQKLRADLEADPRWAPEAARLVELEDAVDVAYAIENVPAAVERCLDGLQRVTTIVRSMKEFAHPDAREKSACDLNRALQTTLAIARNEYKYVADVETDLGELPMVLAHGGELNQVFLNLLVNAAHAIGDVVRGTDRRGTIRIKTRVDGGDAVIEIGDTGTGIPAAVRDRIFEPFFTTKEVGRGTGQGLAISRSVVVDKHGGALTFVTEMGRGTTFVIRLPLDGARRMAA
ncbi:MAG TPA: ATP-binding protein [Polyangia bacterium]